MGVLIKRVEFCKNVLGFPQGQREMSIIAGCL